MMTFSAFFVRTWTSIKKASFARSVLVLSSGTVAGQILALLAMPIIARLYSPAEYGVLGSYTSVVAIVSAVAMLRYEAAIPGSESDADAANLLILAFIIAFCTSAVCALVLFFFATPLSVRLDIQSLAPFLWLVPIGMFVIALYQALSYWAIRKQDFPTLAKTKLVQSAGMTCVQIAFGILHFGPIGLIIGKVLGQSGGCEIIWRRAVGQNRSLFRSVSRVALFNVAFRYRDFPKFSAIAALLGAAYLNLPTLFFATVYGTTVVGWYTLVMGTLVVPISLMSISITQAYFGELAHLKRFTPEHMLSVSWRRLKQVSALGVVMIVSLNIIAPFLIPIAFGTQWTGAVMILQILSPMILVGFIVGPFGCTVDVLRRQDLLLLRETVRLLIIMVALTGAFLSKANWMVAMGLYSVAGVISYLFYAWISWLAARSHATMPSPVTGR
jgi:O-antigen/teichoic acid export membrane protein